MRRRFVSNFSKVPHRHADIHERRDFAMHIHGYQIHNVLNDYRKQLRTGPAKLLKREAWAVVDGLQICNRRSLMDRLSAQIVERIAKGEPQKKEKSQAAAKSSSDPVSVQEKETAFTYTAIDENNRKTSNTLPIKQLNPLNRPAE
jgi:hypothetical protein